jgi:hypothetical protein
MAYATPHLLVVFILISTVQGILRSICCVRGMKTPLTFQAVRLRQAFLVILDFCHLEHDLHGQFRATQRV